MAQNGGSFALLSLNTCRAAEQAFALESTTVGDVDSVMGTVLAATDDAFAGEGVVYNLGKCYFDAKEFDRTASTLKKCKSKKAIFLCGYAYYLVMI